MNHQLSSRAFTLMLLATAPVALADTTIIHAGELLAIPGKPAKSGQTIVIEDGWIVEVKSGFSDPGAFEGEVTVIDLKDQYVLPGVLESHE